VQVGEVCTALSRVSRIGAARPLPGQPTVLLFDEFLVHPAKQTRIANLDYVRLTYQHICRFQVAITD
jgi:hypothetical protein